MFERLFHPVLSSLKSFGQKPDDIARDPIRFGVSVLVLFVLFFGGWSLFARLQSAAIASGKVVVSTNQKVIQHLEGGIVEKIHVKEGDVVLKDAPLITLQNTAVQANFDRLAKRFVALYAKRDRLMAERSGDKKLRFSTIDTRHLKPADVQSTRYGEIRFFRSRKRVLASRIEILHQKIRQLRNEVKALKSQHNSSVRKLHIVRQELKDQRQLYKEGYASKASIIELQKQEADLEGQAGAYLSTMAKVNQSVIEIQQEIQQAKIDRQNEVVSELQTTTGSISDLEERLHAVKDQLDRTVVKAPHAGVIADLNVHTRGGVIQPGDRIMSILPKDETLIIEAHLDPKDIDVVHPNLPVQVYLSAYNMRDVPPLKGKVIYVSPDSFSNRMGQSYYLARVEIDEADLKKLKGVTLHPGMQAEVQIVTGSRTPLQYLLDPIRSSMKRSFKES